MNLFARSAAVITASAAAGFAALFAFANPYEPVRGMAATLACLLGILPALLAAAGATGGSRAVMRAGIFLLLPFSLYLTLGAGIFGRGGAITLLGILVSLLALSRFER